jgi:hypothetical protein
MMRIFGKPNRRNLVCRRTNLVTVTRRYMLGKNQNTSLSKRKIVRRIPMRKRRINLSCLLESIRSISKALRCRWKVDRIMGIKLIICIENRMIQ